MGVRILILSDTHGKHSELCGSYHRDRKLPEADIFIHAGDFCNTGRYEAEIISFNNWLDYVPVPRTSRLVCAGNHDLKFDVTHKESNIRIAANAGALLTNGVYLEDQSITIRGIKVYMSPWSPEFYGWGFNAKRGSEIAGYWNKIPDDVDILVTHGPPYDILDKVSSVDYKGLTSANYPLGCEDLKKRVEQIWPTLHIFGHIHGSRGILTRGPLGISTCFVNASFLDEQYKPHPGPGYTLIEYNGKHDIKILES